MDNEIKFSSEQISSMLERLKGSDKNAASDIQKELSSSLSENQAKQLNNILSDPERVKNILSSPQAKKLFDMIKNKQE